MQTNPRKYRVIKAYDSPYPDPIIFHKEEQVEIGDEFSDDPDWQNWVLCMGENGKRAWVPLQYLVINQDTGRFTKNYRTMVSWKADRCGNLCNEKI